jgi:hypothetical protein
MSKILEGKFEDYHLSNPSVYKLFTQFAKEVKESGFSNYSANSIFERIRWHLDVNTVGDRFKINNNYRPYYARKLMDDDKEFEGFFRVRELQS